MTKADDATLDVCLSNGELLARFEPVEFDEPLFVIA